MERRKNPIKSLTTFICLALSAPGCGHSPSSNPILLWPGTKAYVERSSKLPISETQALNILTGKTKTHPKRFFAKAPLFIVDNEYFFSEPSKLEVPLEGFYVSGVTGDIEYRTSPLSISSGEHSMPVDAFGDIIQIE